MSCVHCDGIAAEPWTDFDKQVWLAGARASNGELFTDLFNVGNWQEYGYPSQSEAVLALCNCIAYHGKNDRELVFRIFLHSQLAQYLLVDNPRHDETWLWQQVDKACVPLQKVQVEQRKVELVPMTDIKTVAYQWLWKYWIVLGKLGLIAGDPGVTKSTLLFYFAAIVSTGGKWPDGTACPKGRVFIFSTEDDAGDTIKPRLQAMGADTGQIHWIRGTRDSKGKLKQFNIATDMPPLKAAAEEFGTPSLLIIDPIYEAVEGDPNKMNEVLDGLAPLVDFASEMNCAVQGLIHLNKNQNARNFLERIIHSRASSWARPRNGIRTGAFSSVPSRTLVPVGMASRIPSKWSQFLPISRR
jgi:hypothetical protein